MSANNNILKAAIQTIQSSISQHGILASPIAADNYKRIWSRDSIIAGLAGILINDDIIIEGLKKSLLTLFQHRHYVTQTIPSNVDPEFGKVSYGSLVGRVDATTWFLIGAAQYYHYSHDMTFIKSIESSVKKMFQLLHSWEYNDRHLINTPLSGNWADEYPYHGYLLYDNCLYFWALSLWSKIWNDETLTKKTEKVKQSITTNYWLKSEHIYEAYHPGLYERLCKDQKPYLISGFHAGGAFTEFDAAANALGLITGIYTDDQVEIFSQYIFKLWEKNAAMYGLIPCFWPVINEGDNKWQDISNNYNYEFKNKPHHFHNGGIWPVWMGLLAYGFSQYASTKVSIEICKKYVEHLSQNANDFSEYIDSKSFHSCGKKPLVYSASGLIFMNHIEKNHRNNITLP